VEIKVAPGSRHSFLDYFSVLVVISIKDKLHEEVAFVICFKIGIIKHNTLSLYVDLCLWIACCRENGPKRLNKEILTSSSKLWISIL
jgi:hypothetical protein